MQVLCITLFAAWATCTAAQSAQCNSSCQLQQRKGLSAAFTALAGPNWTQTEGWLQYYENPNGAHAAVLLLLLPVPIIAAFLNSPGGDVHAAMRGPQLCS